MEGVSAAVLTVVLVVAAMLAVKSYVGKSASVCCGSSDVPKPSRRIDRNPDHYSYHVILRIEGMTCEKCAREVEDALHAIEGIWAEADLEQKRVKIRQKDRIPVEKLCAAIEKAGYHAH